MNDRYLAIPIPDEMPAEHFLEDVRVGGRAVTDECLIFDRVFEKKGIYTEDLRAFALGGKLIEFTREDIAEDLAKLVKSTIEFSPVFHDNGRLVVTGAGYVLSGKIQSEGGENDD